MENSREICPVCTLFLREGITLQAHLDTHPKEQVIEALLKVSNGGTFAPQSTRASTMPSSYVPVQTLANSNSSFLSPSTPYVNPPTQMTTAVTYQHFMTSNGSTFMPQYIQVPTIVNANNNIPAVSNQAMNFVPNQTVNYSHTVYNPLYNPYIPQPYPFTQPLYTSFPVSALPSNDSSFQQNVVEKNSESVESSVESSSHQNHQEKSNPKLNVTVKKCTAATSTETEKRACRSAIKKSILKCTGIRRKKGIFRVKPSDSCNSHSVIKTTRNSSLSLNRVSSLAKRSVIKSIKPKNAPNTLSSLITNLRVNSPPPLTLVSGGSSDSISNSKTQSMPQIKKAPATTPQTENFFKSEDVVDSARPHSTPAMTFGSIQCERKYFRHPQKINSVIVESSNIVKLSNNQVEDCHENFETDKTEIPCVETLNVIESLADNAKDPLCTDINEEVNFNNNNAKSQECDDEEEEEEELEEENFQKQEKDFEEVVIEEMKENIFQEALNQDIPNEISSENIERNCDGSDIFIQQENIFFNEEPGRDRIEENNPNSNLVRISTTGPEKSHEHLNQSPNEYSYYCKEFNELTYNICRSDNELMDENAPKHTELQPITYTDLQPAKSSRLFQDLGLTSSVNFNSFMQVEGIKIFINNNTTTNDPLKLGSIQNNGRDSNGFLKTENQINNRAIVDSVIQLVSANNDSKTEFTFGDNYLATTSQISENQMDLPDLSPMALNIQADESMPARGELSEQESLGAENSTWNLFHGDNGTNIKTFNEWKNDNIQSVSILSSKKTNNKSFKCSTCGKVFSCPKERRVHKNTAHPIKVDKLLPPVKKSRTYACTFCTEVFTTFRERKIHVIQNHYLESKNRRTQIKQESGELESVIVIEKTEVAVKNETEQNNVKTENSIPTMETDSQRVKFCSRCSLPFVGVKKLREHLRLVHGEIRFRCEKCSQCFDEESEYNDHLLIHPLVCDKCGKTFHRKPNLNLHLKRHLEVKPYECSLCPKSFITRQKLEEHMNGHSGKKPLKCTLCDKTFSRHSNLIQHRNLHHLNVKKKIKDFVCRCGEVFHSLRKLEWHKEVHEPKPKPCPFCSQKFIHSASVTRHIRRAHLPDYLPGNNRELDNVQCPICEKVYLRSSLVVHMRVHNGEKPFACKICNKRFSTKWNLELHNWTHQSRSNMPFKCHICKGAFFREPDFVAHLNAHRNYKPFTCNVCGQKFIRKYSCLRHQEEHKKSKQYVCAVSGCAKSFHRGYYLRDHMKVHTGVRPHTCHVCGKASSTKSNHNKHVRIHDTREPVNTEN